MSTARRYVGQFPPKEKAEENRENCDRKNQAEPRMLLVIQEKRARKHLIKGQKRENTVNNFSAPVKPEVVRRLLDEDKTYNTNHNGIQGVSAKPRIQSSAIETPLRQQHEEDRLYRWPDEEPNEDQRSHNGVSGQLKPAAHHWPTSY